MSRRSRPAQRESGTPLTADGAGGVVEIDAALKCMWDRSAVARHDLGEQPGGAEHREEYSGGSVNSAQRFVFDAAQNAIGGGVMVRSYLNRFSMNGG